MGAAVWAEVAKLRRSRVTWGTLTVFSLGPLGIALFMWIVREPDRAAQFGLLGKKADLAGLEPTWPSYATMLTMVVGVGGMLLLSFVVAYLFGREYVDQTAKNLYALPVGRHWFVLAKLMVAAVWWLVLVLGVLVEALLLGLLLGLPDLSPQVATAAVGDVLLAAGISYLLVPPVAWVTVAGRGYLAPLGFALAMLALGNLFMRTGWVDWFPWSIVPSLIGMVGDPTRTLPVSSYVVVAATTTVGVAATLAQVRYADIAE